MAIKALVIKETWWLTGNVSEHEIVSDVTPAGYSFHLATWTLL